MIHDKQSTQISQKQDECYIFAIMKTMCHSGYHHNGFVATYTLGDMMYGYTLLVPMNQRVLIKILNSTFWGILVVLILSSTHAFFSPPFRLGEFSSCFSMTSFPLLLVTPLVCHAASKQCAKIGTVHKNSTSCYQLTSQL